MAVRSSTGHRRVDGSALTAVLPVLALVPVWLIALAVFWLPIQLFVSVPFGWFALGYLAAGTLLFLRPVQRLVLAPLLGARRPDRHERAILDTSWRSVLQANRLSPRRYVLVVLPADELNAFACGGHLVVVTSFAVETLPRDELTGVLAHELSHHLGLHTVALTIGHWLSVPVLVLARVGFFLQNVAVAATRSYASHSAALSAVGRLISAVLTAVSWVFLSGLLLSNAIANAVGRDAEFEADARVIEMGFGKELASALRRVANTTDADRPIGWRERLWITHPAARTRVAKIDASLRARRHANA